MAGGLRGTYEGAENFSVYLGRDRIHVDVVAGEKFASVFHAIEVGRLDLDIFKSGLLEFAAVFIFFERSGYAANPEQDTAANFGGDFAARYYVGDGEASAGLEHAEGFAQDLVFVGGKIDHAIRDDDIDAVVRERDVLDFAFQKLDVFDSGFAFVFVGEGEHLVGHIEAVGFAGGSDSPGGEQHVDASARSEIENDFAGVQLGKRGGIAASERCLQGLLGNLPGLRRVVEIRGDGIASTRWRGTTAGTSSGADSQGGLTVFFFDNFLDAGGGGVLGAHGTTPTCRFELRFRASRLCCGCSTRRRGTGAIPAECRCRRCSGGRCRFVRRGRDPRL